MATSNEGIHGALTIIEDIREQLDSLNDPDCVEGFAIRLEVLKRHLINIEIDAITLELLDRVCRSLTQTEQRYSVSTARPFSCTIVPRVRTGCRGKPSYDVHEGQLNFLLEQGFKVSEISSMMGVSTRTLERRMRLFSISVKGTYSQISDDQLDDLQREAQSLNPNTGIRLTRGFLVAKGHSLSVIHEQLLEENTMFMRP